MDGPTPVPYQAGVGDAGRGPLGKLTGAVIATAKVRRTLHALERPLKARQAVRAAGFQRSSGAAFRERAMAASRVIASLTR